MYISRNARKCRWSLVLFTGLFWLLGGWRVADAAEVEAAQDPTAPHLWSIGIFAGVESADGHMWRAYRAVANAEDRVDRFAGLHISRELGRFWNDRLSIEAEVGGGYRYQNLNGIELWAGLFLRYHGFPWDHLLKTTLAISTGISYVNKQPLSERPTPAMPNRETSNFLHYFSPEVSFALPRYRQHEVFTRLHHRSGVFGTFNGVGGGADTVTLGYRYRF